MHYEQLRRTGRQLDEILVDVKQLIVIVLKCSEVPGGGTYASKHSSNDIVPRRVQVGVNFVVIPFERSALRVNHFSKTCLG